jgi:hypothetical protein
MIFLDYLWKKIEHWSPICGVAIMLVKFFYQDFIKLSYDQGQFGIINLLLICEFTLFLIELSLGKCANLPTLPSPIVGPNEKVDNIKKKLQNNSSHVLGGVGMGGIGKTTLVKKLYHQIHDEFLENVKSLTPNEV